MSGLGMTERCLCKCDSIFTVVCFLTITSPNKHSDMNQYSKGGWMGSKSMFSTIHHIGFTMLFVTIVVSSYIVHGSQDEVVPFWHGWGRIIFSGSLGGQSMVLGLQPVDGSGVRKSVMILFVFQYRLNDLTTPAWSTYTTLSRPLNAGRHRRKNEAPCSGFTAGWGAA